MRAALSGRHPFEVFLLGMCVISGVPLVFGAPRPGSIDAALPDLIARGWGVALAGGAIMALVGILWPNRVTGIVLEQVGLVAVGWACIIYAACVLALTGWAGGVPAALTFAFGAACLVRWRQLQKTLDRAGQS